MIKPLKNNVLIDIHRIVETALQMVDDEEAKVEKATVLDIGDEVTLVSKGDIIYFKKYNLDSIIDGEETYYLIPDEDIKAVYIRPEDVLGYNFAESEEPVVTR